MRTITWSFLVATLLLAPLAGCNNAPAEGSGAESEQQAANNENTPEANAQNPANVEGNAPTAPSANLAPGANAQGMPAAAANGAANLAQLQAAAAQLQASAQQGGAEMQAAAAQLQANAMQSAAQALQAAGQVQGSLQAAGQAFEANAEAAAAGAALLAAAGNTQLQEASAQLQQAAGTVGALGAPLENRPVCQRLLTCCDAQLAIAAAENAQAMGPLAVQACQAAANMGSDESCGTTMDSVRNNLTRLNLEIPEACAP